MRTKVVAGLLFWIPVGGTVLIINFLFDLFDGLWILVPYEYQPEQLLGYQVPGLSFFLSVIVIYLTGHLVSNYFGNQFISLWDKLLNKIPGIRLFYRSIKQMTEAIFVSGETSFQKVFLVEYPRKGLWTVAFETSSLQGEPHGHIMNKEGESVSKDKNNPAYVNLFVPTTPNPTSGYFVVTHRSSLVELQMSVDDALKMIVSGGIFVPKTPNQEIPNSGSH
jgi:uncharacterized membrane protein